MAVYYCKKTITKFMLVGTIIAILIGLVIIKWVPLSLLARATIAIVALLIIDGTSFALGVIVGDEKKSKSQSNPTI